MSNYIYSINGPVITVKNALDFSMLEMVYVGKDKLMGEVISISDEFTTIQVYESTTGLTLDDEVIKTGSLVSMDLGPGLLGNIFDGIGRPLKKLNEIEGSFIKRGNLTSSLDEVIKRDTTINVKVGDILERGHLVASCMETTLIKHYILNPYDNCEVVEVKDSGFYAVNEVIVKVKTNSGIKDICSKQKQAIKLPREIKKRLPISIPLITGQRVIDSLFPIAKGGSAAIPGGFGAGKTMLQHQFAKWCDADIIVYVGCGERGNEMTQVLEEFSSLVDPKSKMPLIERTVLIANTSNMPVAAREASIYTGITIAEYYRDMGYHVAVMADSTSRWAEALREISGRLEEMPAEEGFPSYLPSRLANFYERAGYVETLGGKIGSVSIIGAVSPQGADFSEPVTQNTKRFVRAFWALDKELAYKRHYASVNWNISYSDYVLDLSSWYYKFVSTDFIHNRQKIISLLSMENKLLEIVKLVGGEMLPDDQKLIIKIGELIRVGFLQQNAFHIEDAYVPLTKQNKMMEVILYLYDSCKNHINDGKTFNAIINTGIFEKIAKMKYDVPNNNLELFDNYYILVDDCLRGIN